MVVRESDIFNDIFVYVLFVMDLLCVLILSLRLRCDVIGSLMRRRHGYLALLSTGVAHLIFLPLVRKQTNSNLKVVHRICGRILYAQSLLVNVICKIPIQIDDVISGAFHSSWVWLWCLGCHCLSILLWVCCWQVVLEHHLSVLSLESCNMPM